MPSRIKSAVASQDNESISEHEPEILYEFLTYVEWPQEPELLVRSYSTTDEVFNKRNVSYVKTALWSIFSSMSGYIPAEVSRLINNRLSWLFAAGGNGKVVAILQDSWIEIRSSKDEYSNVVGKCFVAKDAFPQWRRLAWSPDCSLLALSYSNGCVDCFDALGNKLFSIETPSAAPHDLSDALVAIHFVDTRVHKTHWFYEIILINYKGILRSCFVSPTGGVQDYHSFNLSKCFSQGVTSSVYSSKYNTIICSGIVSVSSTACAEGDLYLADQCGIVTWRLLSDSPYYRLSQSLEEEQKKRKISSANLFQKIPALIFYGNKKSDTILKLCLSLDSTMLVAIHISGALSLWDVPSLRLRKMWPLQTQPDFNMVNPSCSYPIKKKKNHGSQDPLRYHLVDVNWWSEKALIIARYSGAVAVSSIHTLNNLLGSSLEWFESQPQVSASYDKSFLVMECETMVNSKRRSVSPDSLSEEEVLEDVDESSDDEAGTIIHKTSTFVKTALYYITDSEKFQPPRRKPKILTKNYRLICLKSTTPEELFARKLDDEMYGEAIELAKAYDLDCDLVYLRQWRNAKVSLATIQDYLSKIAKRCWVLHECLERVPEDIESARALLTYGLQGTSLDTLISIGNGTDDGKFVMSDSEVAYDDLNAEDDDVSKLKEINVNARDDLVSQMQFSKLTIEQQNLCLTRQKLLRYIDRLATYEVLLGGPMIADEYFDYKFFNNFRSQPAVEATVKFARESNWQFVAAMFTYHGNEILSHRLPILSNFPETTPPFEYRSLLPECAYDNKHTVYPWEQESIREPDWVESEACRKVVNRNMMPSLECLYEGSPELEKYNSSNITTALLTMWYIERSAEIERRSRLVNNSLELINLAMERNVPGLERLHDDLLTMEVLVYECYVDESITFDCLQSMKDCEKIHLLMSSSSEDSFVKNVRRWLIPFLSRCEKYSQGSWKGLMRDYLLSLAKYDLTLCVKIFQNSHVEQQHPILTPAIELMRLALDCIYTCQEDMQLNNAFAILECLPQRGFGSQTEETNCLHDELDELEKHLSAAEILEKHGINKSVACVKSSQKDLNEVKQLLRQMTRVVSRKEPPPDEAQWKELLEDVLELQTDVFDCIDKNTCAEIFAETLLCSGKKENILLASGLFKSGSKANSNLNSKMSTLAMSLPAEHIISDEKASLLVINAAMEYFNSSSNLKDSAMELAKQCLKLMVTPTELVLAELDLIDSLPILSFFEVNILPLQVRICTNRLELIRQIFKSKPDAYKESQKLMTLGHFLRVGQDVREWEEQIYILIASAALQAKDFIASYNACESLMSHKYFKGWDVCLALGKCELFKDIKARQCLLAFSEIYCTGDTLEEIIETMQSLESHLLKQKLEALIDIAEVQRSSLRTESITLIDQDNAMNENTFTTNLHQFTTKATKQVLASVGNAEFWKRTMSWVTPGWQTKKNVDSDSFLSDNIKLNRLSVPEFYMSLLPNAMASPLMTKFDSYAIPDVCNPSLSIGLILVQIALLDKAQERNYFLQVLQQVSVNLLPLDSTLGLAHLLALEDPQLIDACIQQLPNSDVCLHLAVYCIALHICQLAELVKPEALLTSDPNLIIKYAIRFAQTRTSTKSHRTFRKYCELLQVYEKRRADFAQGRLLQSLGRGVDVARFSQDDQYKQETVLGLVMTTEEKVYNTAITLARKYNVPLWEVYISHLEYLFADEEIYVPNIERRVTDLQLLPALMNNLPKFQNRMTSTIYATISGCDHARLLYYFSLLSQCAPKDKDYQNHIGVLRKLQALSQGLDYKAVVSGKHDVLKLIMPVLTASNVHLFAKLSSQLSKCCKQTLDASMVYRTWLLKIFYEKDKKEVTQLSHKEWISRYNSCKDFFDKLLPDDLAAFIEGSLFTEMALDDMTESTRRELLNRTLKYAKFEMGKHKEESTQRISWQNAVNYFEKALKHLEWMQGEHVNDLRQLDDKHLRQFLRALDLSISHPDKIKSLLFECVMEGHPLEMLQQLISVCPPEISIPPGDVVIETVSQIKEVLRHNTNQCSKLFLNKDCIAVLHTIVDDVIAHDKQGGDLVDRNDIAAELHPLCTDSLVEIAVKLHIFLLLEKIYPKGSEELENLSLLKAQAFIDSSWPDLQVMSEEMKNEESKEKLFVKLLEQSNTLQQAEMLVKLLLCWPTLPSTYNNFDLALGHLQVPSLTNCHDQCVIINVSLESSLTRLFHKYYEENSWCKIIHLLLKMQDEKKLDSVICIVRVTEEKCRLSLECLEIALTKLIDLGSLLHSLKFALLTTHSRLHDIVLSSAATCDEEHVVILDDEVCSLLIQRKVTAYTVPTVLYKTLLPYIRNHLQFDAIKEIALDLKQHGYYCEAASLLSTGANVPTSLTTLNSALELLKRWL